MPALGCPGNASALYLLTRSGTARYEFIFTALTPGDGGPELLAIVQVGAMPDASRGFGACEVAVECRQRCGRLPGCGGCGGPSADVWHKRMVTPHAQSCAPQGVSQAYEGSRLYRELKLRGAIITDNDLRLLPGEQAYSKVGRGPFPSGVRRHGGRCAEEWCTHLAAPKAPQHAPHSACPACSRSMQPPLLPPIRRRPGAGQWRGQPEQRGGCGWAVLCDWPPPGLVQRRERQLQRQHTLLAGRPPDGGLAFSRVVFWYVLHGTQQAQIHG